MSSTEQQMWNQMQANSLQQICWSCWLPNGTHQHYIVMEWISWQLSCDEKCDKHRHWTKTGHIFIDLQSKPRTSLEGAWSPRVLDFGFIADFCLASHARRTCRHDNELTKNTSPRLTMVVSQCFVQLAKFVMRGLSWKIIERTTVGLGCVLVWRIRSRNHNANKAWYNRNGQPADT